MFKTSYPLLMQCHLTKQHFSMDSPLPFELMDSIDSASTKHVLDVHVTHEHVELVPYTIAITGDTMPGVLEFCFTDYGLPLM